MCDDSGVYGLNEISFSLSKAERLHLKNEIDMLFQQGTWFSVGAFSVVYRFCDGDSPAIFIAVPKKHQRNAHQRVRTRRLVREAYRLNKHILFDALRKNNKNMHFAIVRRGPEAMTYQQVESKIILTLHRLSKVISK